MNKEYLLIKEIKKHLEKSLDYLDPRTLARIAGARKTALNRKSGRSLVWLWPTAGLAAAMALVLFFFMTGKPDPTRVASQPLRSTAAQATVLTDNLEILEMIANENYVELFENMEFYTWLLEHAPIPDQG